MDSATDSTLLEFVRYNTWANAQVFEACAKLDASSLAATAAGTYGTVYDTIHHIIQAEADYWERVTHESLRPSFQWEDKPDLGQMAAFAAQVGVKWEEAAGRYKPTDMVREEWQGQFVQYPVLALVIQLVNHGIEHRAHISTILAQQNIAMPEVDGWNYMWSHAERLGVGKGG